MWYLQDESETWEDDIFIGNSATKKVFLSFLKINNT